MSKTILGSVRQSAVLMNYGPGAIIDFRTAGGASVSVMSGGLELWEEAFEKESNADDYERLYDKRLCAKLDVDYFKIPPVVSSEDLRGKPRKRRGAPQGEESFESIFLPGVRFPDWLQCPKCNRIKPSRKWASEIGGSLSLTCPSCSRDDKPIHVVPVRFVTACRSGHIDEFPWNSWVHKDRSNCTNKDDFRLEVKGSGLKGMTLICPKCNAKASMEHIFKASSLPSDNCSGSRPWLVNESEDCKNPMQVMQRGASNLYFPLTMSALTIPPWSEQIIRLLRQLWEPLASIPDPADRRKRITQDWDWYPPQIKNMGFDTFVSEIESILTKHQSEATNNLRWDEYRQLISGNQREKRHSEFVVVKEDEPREIYPVSGLYRVKALREIRALRGFTRIEAPPGGRIPVIRQTMSKWKKPRWLPAIEVRGEGIFFTLDEDLVFDWSNLPNVMERADQIKNPEDSDVLNPDGERNISISSSEVARYLLLHSLAHMIIKQLSLQCGYSSASLRERVYSAGGDHPMAGVLVFTASSDSDGTLGGLQRQADLKRFVSSFREAIVSNTWCSSDPLCITDVVSQSEPYNLAACHGCLQLPETSCEEHNRFLDRAMLYGTKTDRDVGFFSKYLDQWI